MDHLEKSEVEIQINSIFQTAPNAPNRLNKRESGTIEFKANFHKGGKSWEEYGKTIAAFANNKGGFLVFGVKNRPHDLIGLGNNNFDEFDPAKLTEFLNKMFAPEINWSKHLHEIDGKRFGILRIEECTSKPIVAISNGQDHIKEAEIYYRYRGRSEKVKYPELKKILDNVRQREQDNWMRHLQRIASIGVDNAAIFNPDDGTVTGKSGTFVIDKSLLPKLSFIHEGEFREVTGAPAIKLVGEAQILAAGEVYGKEIRVERQSIRAKDIVEFFLEQKKPDKPEFFIEQACHEPTGYLPIYYFCSLGGLTRQDILDLVMREESSQQGKRKLIERIQCEDVAISEDIPDTGSQSSIQKKEFRQSFINKAITDPENETDLTRKLSALRNLNVDEIDKDYIFPIMKRWYEIFWERGSIIRTNLYKTICHLDKQCFCQEEFYS